MAEVDQTVGRRAFLTRLAGAIGAFLAAAVGVPLAGAVVAPGLRREETQWVPIGSIASFSLGKPRLVSFGISKTDGYLKTTSARAVWVLRISDDQLIVYNARCTHLGCLVNYQSVSQAFISPCHGGVFAAADGSVLDGPPPRPLDRLGHRVVNGQVTVEYRDFLAGVPDRVPL